MGTTKFYTESEFNSPINKIGIMPKERIIADAKRQSVEISEFEAVKLLRIEKMCHGTKRIVERIQAFNNAGLFVSECPMKTGFGIARCIKRMANGRLRVRVSANWMASKYGNYALCVHI